MKTSPIAIALTVTLVIAAIGPVGAKERAGVDALLVEAAELTGQDKILDAARTYGKAARLAQRHEDLEEEARAGRALGRFLSEVRPPHSWSEAMSAVIQALDARHAGAYVSAHALAREVLLRSSRTGDRTGVPVAAEALSEFAKGKRRGKAAQALAAYGDGLLLLDTEGADDERRAKVAAALEGALAACVEERWTETACMVGTELAVLRLATGDATGARDALARAAEAVEDAGGYPDSQVLILWSNAVRARLADAPEDVLAPHLEALKPLHGGRSEPGGAGRNAGSDPCRLGRLWKRFGARKTLVTVARGGSDHVVRLGYVRGHEVERSFRTGHRYLVVDGIILGFHGHAVTLERIDLSVVPGASSGGPCRTGLCAWYLLADGETWSLRKDGEVRIQAR